MDHHRKSLIGLAESNKARTKRIVLYIWDAIVAFSTILSIFFVTFQAFYNADLLWQLSLIYIMDVVYFANIIVTFFRSYMKRGVKITDYNDIAWHYICTTFFLDLVSVFPLEVFCFAAGSNSLFVSALLRFNRCIRCYKMWTFLCKLDY